MATLISINPATGEPLRELETTPIDELPRIFSQARAAQERWAGIPLRRRAKSLITVRETLLDNMDDLAATISAENGKPRFEAITNELITSLETLTFFAKRAPRALRDHRIPLHLMKHRRSTVNHWPLGVVAIISPWNYPFLLPFAEVVMALVAGNAVVFKPSEETPLVGLKIQELFDRSGFPPYLLQTLIGDGSLGAAIIQQRPNKIFFTGSVNTGKKIMAAASEHLIPVNLELGGKDPMIVLPDADLDYATSAALWGGFSNSGQVCASTERILVHESMAEPFLQTLKEKLGRLRQGPPTDQNDKDMGAITLEKQKKTYQTQLEQARNAKARFVTGGEFSENRRFLEPTVIAGPGIEKLDVYNEETFGPVVAVATYRSVAEAIEKANHNRYGLLASVITKNISLGEEVARQLQVGTVTINEVVYTAGLPETPWGGVKDSGFGRTHSELGLLEFVNIRHIHKPRSRLLVFKSPWWFPYTPHQLQAFREFANLYRRHWIDKLRAIPHVLVHFVKFLKEEKRL